VLHDGDSLTLGDTTVETYHTPGLTPGVTSLQFPVWDSGREYRAFVLGGLGLNTVNGLRAARQFIQSVERVLSMPGLEVNLTNHPARGKIFERRDRSSRRSPGDPHPFVDPGRVRAFLEGLVESARAKLQAEEA